MLSKIPIEPAAAMVSAAAIFTAQAGTASVPVVRASEQIRVGDRLVRVDTYESEGSSAGATVLILHGVGGLLGDGGLMRRAAKSFARAGFKACVPHYFNVTGHLFITPSHAREKGAVWKAAVDSIVDHYSSNSADGRVAIFGYSMGGFLAVGSARGNSSIPAVVVLSGGLLAENENDEPEHLPPILILHGGKDSRVTPDRADALANLAVRSGADVESLRYPGEGHAFSSTAEKDAIARAVSFIKNRTMAE